MAIPAVLALGARVGMPVARELIKKYGPGIVDAVAGTGIGAFIGDKLFFGQDVRETPEGVVIGPEEKDPPTLEEIKEKNLETFPGEAVPVEKPTGFGEGVIDINELIKNRGFGEGYKEPTLEDLTSGGGFTPTDVPDMSIITMAKPKKGVKIDRIPSNKELEEARKELNENFKKANREDFEKYPGNVQNALIKKGYDPEGAFELGYKDFPLEMKYAILEGRMDVPTRYFDDYKQLSFEDRIKTNLMIDFGDQFKPVIKNEKIASFERIKDVNLPDISSMRTLDGYKALDGVTYTNPYVIEEMIKLDRQTIRDQRNIPDPDATRKQNFSDKYKNKVYDIYKYGIQDKQGNTLVEAKIPDLVKGHEANRYKREELGERELEQVTYPTFYTNTWRNQKHKILEGDEAIYKKELKKLTATKESREKNADRIQEINTAISLIGKDLETLLLPTTRLDEKTGKFRFSGKYTANPKELLDSINSEKKLFYFGSEFDLRQKERMKTSYKDFDFTTETINGVETHVANLPKGFSKGGIVDIRKMIRPINAQR
jgi:hypothetical protein